MTILWFFLVISWNGTVEARHGFPNERACYEKQQEVAQLYRGIMREVTVCIGLPLGVREES